MSNARVLPKSLECALQDPNARRFCNNFRRRAMTNQRNLQGKPHIKGMLVMLTLALTQLSLPPGNKAMTNSTPAPTPTDTCIAQAFVKVEKV
jgi:hypothetical protein